MKDDDGNYIKAVCGTVDDNRLRHVLVTSDGIGQYIPLGLKFKISNIGWNSVKVFKNHQVVVVDRIIREWCEFDNNNDVEFDDNKTYDWWVSN